MLGTKRKRGRLHGVWSDWKVIALVGGLFFLATMLGILAALQFTPVQKKYLYPYPFQEVIEAQSKKYKIDRDLVAGVILSESRFEPEAKSHRGAMGLMQLMPETAQWISIQMEDEAFSTADLYVPEKNIMYGTWYLAYLKRHFHGNEVLTLAAYNAGLGNVEEWMMEHGWDMDFTDISQIPFPETRHYVHSVLENRKKYKTLYRGQ